MYYFSFILFYDSIILIVINGIIICFVNKKYLYIGSYKIYIFIIFFGRFTIIIYFILRIKNF